MATKVRKHTTAKKIIRFKRKGRINDKISHDDYRVVVYKSNSNFYLQLRHEGKTLLSVSTLSKDLKEKFKKNLDGAKELGKLLGAQAKDKKIDKVVFDRNGYSYHGLVKAAADGLREAGIKV